MSTNISKAPARIQHHTLSSSHSSSITSQPFLSLAALTTRNVAISAAVLSASALAVYQLSHRYTLTSAFPYLARRPVSPLSDPVVGVHALADLAHYRSSHILIPNPASFITKRQRLIAGGPSALQLISDFDHTLSAFSSLSSHGTLEHAAELPADYMPKVQALFDHYYPIEMDHSMSHSEKEQVMVDWWEAAHALLLEYRFNRAFVASAVRQAITQHKLSYRPAASALVHYTHAHSIPLLVFSAGLGNTIEEFLRQTDTALPNVDVVSNFMRFDEAGTLVGFQPDLIHSLNKNYSHVVRQRDERRTASSDAVVGQLQAPKRRNVILLGDSVGDVQMSEGLDEVDVILRVGWLNGEWPVSSEKLAKYEAVYDVLVGNNGGMEMVLELLQMICEPSE